MTRLIKLPPNRAPFSAKLVSPRLHNPVLRPRLFQRLDRLRESAILWLVGPPGAGKTTLASTYLSEKSLTHLWYQIDAGDADAASFFLHLKQAIQQAAPRSRQSLPLLTPEYVPGLTAFVRLYAEALAKCLKKPALIVLDNYEQVPPDAALHEIVRELTGSLPPDVGLMILSRTQPPPAFTRLRLHGDLAVVHGEELNLTAEEAQTFAESGQRNPKAIDAERVDRILKQSQGWIAGFVFLLGTHQAAGHGASETEEAGGNPQLIFDYFTTEVFGHFSPTVRCGLVCSALLPAMTISHLARITGDSEVAAVLAELQRRNCFVVQRGQGEPVYEYHALFRRFCSTRPGAYSQRVNGGVFKNAPGICWPKRGRPIARPTSIRRRKNGRRWPD